MHPESHILRRRLPSVFSVFHRSPFVFQEQSVRQPCASEAGTFAAAPSITRKPIASVRFIGGSHSCVNNDFSAGGRLSTSKSVLCTFCYPASIFCMHSVFSYCRTISQRSTMARPNDHIREAGHIGFHLSTVPPRPYGIPVWGYLKKALRCT